MLYCQFVCNRGTCSNDLAFGWSLMIKIQLGAVNDHNVTNELYLNRGQVLFLISPGSDGRCLCVVKEKQDCQLFIV